ncbi:MAG: FixH family protein [Verrucomicrobiota bacterium]
MKRNLWPLGIILTFAVFISGTAGLIVLAASHKSDLVSADYYEHELKYQSHHDSLERANRLPIPGFVKYEAVRRVIEIAIPPQHAGEASGAVELYRPSAAGLDQTFPLELSPDGLQRLDAKTLQPGLWKVRVTWKFAGEEFCLEQKVVIPRNF